MKAARAELVEISAPEVSMDDEGMVVWNDDDTIELTPTDAMGEAPMGDPAEHDANLAEHIDESDLALIAEDLIEAYESDKQARQDWERRLAKGIETVGFAPPPEGGGAWPGAATVTYPIIAEAVVQFNARAMDELFPSAGPVKTVVVGRKTREKQEQAERVEDYMNYQITEEDQGWYDEDDRLTMRLPFDGHAWKKVYRDERLGIQTSKFVSGHEVYAPYNATSMDSIPRLCHAYPMRANAVKFEQLTGNWIMCDLQDPPGDEERDQNEVQMQIDAAEGSAPTGQYDKNKSHTILEFYVDYDLKGFEHVSDEDGEPTGFALPYIITMEEHSRKVLRISRNWMEGDQRFRKRINLIPFRFLPGLGFYGFGFLHIIGSLNEAATGALRAMLDNAARNNLSGGFLSSDARIKGGALSLAPGEWKQVDASAEELAKTFFTPPVHPVPDALFKLLGMLVEAGKSFTSTTEAMTGAAPSTGPVGTMVALIEQGSKVFSGIHKRLHKSKRAEYRLLAELNAENIPEQGYPYDVGVDPSESRVVFAKDFGPEVDVLPISDPNIYSAQQKIAIAQALLELATTNPDLYDRRESHRRMLEALKVPAIDDVLLDPDNHPQLDPVSENAKMLMGQPAKAVPGQVHQAHIAVHMSFLQHPGYGGNPTVAEIIVPLMTAHLAEHAALMYREEMLAAMGVPQFPLDSEESDEDQAIPPEMQEAIAVKAAQLSAQFMQGQGALPPPPPDPAQAQAEAEMAMRQQEMEMKQAQGQADMERKAAEMQIKQAGAMADEQRKGMAFTAEERRKMEAWMIEQRRLEEEHAAEMKRTEESADQQLELAKEKAEAQKKAAAQQAKAKAAKPAEKKGA